MLPSLAHNLFLNSKDKVMAGSLTSLQVVTCCAHPQVPLVGPGSVQEALSHSPEKPWARGDHFNEFCFQYIFHWKQSSLAGCVCYLMTEPLLYWVSTRVVLIQKPLNMLGQDPSLYLLSPLPLSPLRIPCWRQASFPTPVSLTLQLPHIPHILPSS